MVPGGGGEMQFAHLKYIALSDGKIFSVGIRMEKELNMAERISHLPTIK